MPRGTGVSVGIGMAQALIWQAPVAFDYIPRKSAQPSRELERFETSRLKLLRQTELLRQKTERQFGSGEAVIFDAYHMMLEDDDALLDPLRSLIQSDNCSAEYAVTVQFDELARQFLMLEDDYMRQRVDDVFSLRDQLMRELMGMSSVDVSHLDRPTVIVAHSLSPADIANLDISRLEGIVCETGGYSSHMSIIARTMGVPAVVGALDVMGQIRSGDLVALDGETGEIWIDPEGDTITMLRQRSDALLAQREETQRYRGMPTISLDGRRVELSANVAQLEDVDAALGADAEALGLFRTELLQLNSPEPPDEERQFQVYRAMLEKMGGKAATVRTFDDGGSHAGTPAQNPLRRTREPNPVLGYRGIRMCLGRPSFFRTQLRALLRASAYGSLKVMFPMISSLDELRDALKALEHVKAELRREAIPFDEKMPVGVDIEVPSAALLSETLSQEVDFLSIGINDLIQFTMAIDRGNPDLAYLYHQFHPQVLRLVRWTVDAAHNSGIPCVICGEAPGQEDILPLLFGIGVDGFSVSPNLLLRCRQILSQCSYAECRDLANEVLQLQTAGEVMKRLGHRPRL